MRLPAIALDQHGFVADVNAAADAVFDQNINIKDRRLFVRNPDARTLLKNAVDQLKELPRLDSLALEPVIVPRMDKLPVIVRIWPFEGPPGQDMRALLTPVSYTHLDVYKRQLPGPADVLARRRAKCVR